MSDTIGFRAAKTPKTEFVASLERGLRVLQTFSREHAQLTLSEVAVLTELSPATARRSLHTLEMLGYVGRAGRRFLRINDFESDDVVWMQRDKRAAAPASFRTQ